MWIEGNRSTRHLAVKEFGDDGELLAIHEAEFNHNGRARVSDKAGKFLLKEIPALKSVKDGGPKEEADPESAEAVTEKESTDG